LNSEDSAALERLASGVKALEDGLKKLDELMSSLDERWVYYVPLMDEEDGYEDQREAARKMLATCSADLGLGEVRIHFYREELPSERRAREAAYAPGRCKEACAALGRLYRTLGPSKGSVHPDKPGEMSVCVTGSHTDVAFTVAHEARYLWQYHNGQFCRRAV